MSTPRDVLRPMSGLSAAYIARAVVWAFTAGVCIAPSAAAQTIRGHVVDERRVPVPRAEVQILPSGHPILTDTAGAFDLGPLSDGVYSVRIRRVGFEPVTARVVVPLAGPHLVIELRHTALALDTVRTVAIESRLPRLFLREQEHLGAQLHGPALDSMFARGGSRSLADMLTIDRRFAFVVRKPHGGVLCVFVDGWRVQGPLEEYVTRREISAMEAYDSPDFVHEPFIDGEPKKRCGRLILIWSKYYVQPHWAGH